MTQLIFPAIINTVGSTDGQYLKSESGIAVWSDVEGGTWGSITGTISDQIDLFNALVAKFNVSDTSALGRSLVAAANPSDARTVLGITNDVNALDPLALTTDLIPATDDMYSLGSATHRWKDIFVSANTIYLGDATQLSGTSIVVDAGPSPTNLAQIPTLKASKIIAVPYTYVSGGTPITVRPSIEFQIGMDSYPISLNTSTFEFSLDAQGNYGTGSLVAKKVTLNNETGTALSLTGAIAHSGGYLNTQTDKTFRFDGDMILGYDAARTIRIKGSAIFENGVQFNGLSTIGDGNDSVAVNAGVNPFTVISSNFSIDSAGNIVVSGNLTISGTTTTINSNTLNIGDNIIVLNADLTGGDVPTQDAGIQIGRGQEAAARWLWNETIDAWSPMGADIRGVGTLAATNLIGSLTGNATSATMLSVSRTINGVAFDGSANITIFDATKEPVLSPGLTGQYYRGDKTWQTLDATAVGLDIGIFGASMIATSTAAQGTALLNLFTTNLKGLVPPPVTSSGSFLKDDGTWATPPSFALTDGTKGEITVSQGGTVWTIDANVITTGKLQQIATDSFLGRTTDLTGNVEVLSTGMVRTMLAIDNVDNTSDADKPISAAAQTAISAKVDKGLIASSELTMSSGGLVGRSALADGQVEEIVVGNGLTLAGSQLSVEFTDTGWASSVTAIGTAAPQNIELPESGLVPLDVIVFSDGIRFYSNEYTITGSTLVMTSNYAGDQIEIIKMPTRTILYQPTAERSVMADSSSNFIPTATATTRHVRLTSDTATTVTIPALFPIGTELVFEQAGLGEVTIVGDTGITVVSRGNRFKSAGQYAVIVIKKVETSLWVVSGDVKI